MPKLVKKSFGNARTARAIKYIEDAKYWGRRIADSEYLALKPFLGPKQNGRGPVTATIIGWLSKVIRRNRGKKLVFVGAGTKIFFESARILAQRLGLKQNEVIFLPISRETLKDEKIVAYLRGKRLATSKGTVLIDFIVDRGTTLRTLRELLVKTGVPADSITAETLISMSFSSSKTAELTGIPTRVHLSASQLPENLGANIKPWEESNKKRLLQELRDLSSLRYYGNVEKVDGWTDFGPTYAISSPSFVFQGKKSSPSSDFKKSKSSDYYRTIDYLLRAEARRRVL